MPITKREDAKEGGFAQVREALQKFKGLCTDAVFDMWGGQLVDDQGRPRQPREFLELSFTDVEVLEATEELAMDISEQWTIRENCSDYKGSFWVEMFLASADKFKILVPDGLKGKILTMEKQTLEAFDKDGNPKPEYNATNYVIVGVEEVGTKAAKTTAPKPVATTPVQGDPMDIVETLAIGKTEAELTAALNASPELATHPMGALAKAGMITQALVNANRLALVDGKYQKAA